MTEVDRNRSVKSVGNCEVWIAVEIEVCRNRILRRLGSLMIDRWLETPVALSEQDG